MNLTTRDAWWFRVLIQVSVLINVICGGRCHESLCARYWRCQETSRWARFGIWFMDKLEPGHCRLSAAYHSKLRGRHDAAEELLKRNQTVSP